MAEWLRRGLQILARRFDSGSGLHATVSERSKTSSKRLFFSLFSGIFLRISSGGAVRFQQHFVERLTDLAPGRGFGGPSLAAGSNRNSGLTANAVNHAKPREKPYKLSDRDGVYLLVKPRRQPILADELPL